MSAGVDGGGLQARRRAALALHALHPEDRRGLLGALAEPRQRQLRPLLDELAELGIPPDAGLLPLPAASQRTHANGGLDAPDLRELAGVLRAEPRGVAEAVMACSPWPWTPRLAKLIDVRRGGLAGDRVAVAPALAESLRKAVEEELSRRSASNGPKPSRRWLRAILELAGRLR